MLDLSGVTQEVTGCHSELQKLQERKCHFQQREGNKVCKRGISGLSLVRLCPLIVRHAMDMLVRTPPSVTPRLGYILVITESHSIIKLHVVGVSLIKAMSCELLDSSEHYLNIRRVGLPSSPAGVFELMERARI